MKILITKKSTARRFAHNNANDNGEITGILFAFTIDTRLHNTKPFADISQLSAEKKEAEVLVMSGSIFKIREVKYDEQENIWIATLSLCSENDYELKELTAQFEERDRQ